ncbi:hypothetical protein B8W90_12080, partial [Staphylococcus hominis]
LIGHRGYGNVQLKHAVAPVGRGHGFRPRIALAPVRRAVQRSPRAARRRPAGRTAPGRAGSAGRRAAPGPGGDRVRARRHHPDRQCQLPAGARLL